MLTIFTMPSPKSHWTFTFISTLRVICIQTLDRITAAVITEEKDFILDAFALLGGNENLVSQILERLEEMSYRWRRGTCVMYIMYNAQHHGGGGYTRGLRPPLVR